MRLLIKIASKRAIQKAAEATGDLIGNKIADKINISQKSSKELHSQNNYDNDEIEITKERHISPYKKTTNYWWIKISIIIMEYKKIINLLDNTSNQLSKFRTKIGLK